MDEKKKSRLAQAEDFGNKNGWVAPLTQADKDYFAYLRVVFARYNITPSKATEREYDFVLSVAQDEFYQQRAQA